VADINRCAGQFFLERCRGSINRQHQKLLLAISRAKRK
jgi:hypothetical protein